MARECREWQHGQGRRLTSAGDQAGIPGARRRASVPATCGELVQGWLAGAAVLVSCPIDRFVTAEVELLPAGEFDLPAGHPKVARALRLALDRFGPAGAGARLTLSRDLPVAKGFGTSTADIAATIVAAARAAGHEPSPRAVADLAVQIEPTDSSIFPGLAAYDYRCGSRVAFLGQPPPLALAVIDLGGTIDTVEFNRRPVVPKPGSEAEFQAALELLRRGVQEQRPDWVGQAATRSALLHQGVLPKPALPGLIEVVQRHGGLGVVIAHSGTLAGLLTDGGDERAAVLLRAGLAAAGPAATGFVARLVGGGWGRPASDPAGS